MNDIFTSNEYELEYELFQTYPRFKVYNVYKKYKNTGEKKFLYRVTKERTDYGKHLIDRQSLLEELNKRLKIKDEESINFDGKSETIE